MPANPLGLALRNRHAGHHTLVWARPTFKRLRTSPSPARPSTTAPPSPSGTAGGFSGPTFHPPSPGQRRQPNSGTRAHRPRPRRPFAKPATHALTLGIDPSLSGIPENGLTDPSPIPGLKHGKGPFGHRGWAGPKPPRSHGPHSYVFQLFALDSQVDLPDKFHPRRCTPRHGRTCRRTRSPRRHLRNPVTAHQQRAQG